MKIDFSCARNVLTAAALAVGMTTSLATPASAAPLRDDAPPSGQITISVVAANGTGCKPGTRTITVAPNNTAFTILYNDYTAEVRPADPDLVRKNCQLTLWVHVPQGFTYAIAKADYRGFASLARGARAIEKASYYFQGDSRTVGASHSFSGPLADNWQTKDEAEVGALVYAPCGEVRYFNANTELRVDKGTSKPSATSSITMDSTDVSITTKYHFAWKRCDER